MLDCEYHSGLLMNILIEGGTFRMSLRVLVVQRKKLFQNK